MSQFVVLRVGVLDVLLPSHPFKVSVRVVILVSILVVYFRKAVRIQDESYSNKPMQEYGSLLPALAQAYSVIATPAFMCVVRL